MPSWDPTQYARFAAERARPFEDLVARVGAAAPRLVVDLGCGDGPRTLDAARRWPFARVIAIDSSAAMLGRARELAAKRLEGARVTWVQADLVSAEAHAVVAEAARELGVPGPDVVIAAASLQWVPDQLAVAAAWADALAPGGWLAVQVPGNMDAPSHALMREVAAEHPRAAELAPTLLTREKVATPAEYVAALGTPGRRIDAWETTYTHLLDPDGRLDNPVLEWVRGTGLRPVLDTLTDEGEREAFITAYDARLREAYRRTPVGVPFEFRRVFCVVQVAG